jgi:hypothetical protein
MRALVRAFLALIPASRHYLPDGVRPDKFRGEHVKVWCGGAYLTSCFPSRSACKQALPRCLAQAFFTGLLGPSCFAGRGAPKEQLPTADGTPPKLVWGVPWADYLAGRSALS